MSISSIRTVDPTAVHDDTASEISAITNKATPAGGDFLLIEDSAAGNIKKHILISALPSGGSPPTGTGFRHVTGGAEDAASETVTFSDADQVTPNQGTTVTVLHGNAAGQPSFAAVVLTADVSGILPGANGGTGNGFAAISGPTTSLKTFTLPDASAVILTDNADVTVAQGGTGLSSGTSGGVLGYTAAGTLASSVALTASQLVIGGGAGATPTPLAAGTDNFVLRMGAANPGYEAELLSKDITIEAPTASETITMFYTPIAITATEVRVVGVGTTPSLTLQLKHATDRSLGGNALTTSAEHTNTTTGSTATLSDATIPAASYVWIETTATSGTVTSFAIHVRYTVD